MNARFAHACDVSGARQQWQAHDWLRVLQSSWTRIECPTKFIQLRRASPHIESMIGKDEELLQSRAPSRTRSLPERVPCMPCHWYVSSASKRARITSDDVATAPLHDPPILVSRYDAREAAHIAASQVVRN